MNAWSSATSGTEPAKQSIQPGDRAALKRWLSVLRDAGTIAPAALPPITPQDQIFEEFDDYLRRERGLAPKSIVSHLPVDPPVPARGVPCRRRRPGQDQSGRCDPLHRAPRPGLEPEVRQGDVLVAARISPIPPSQRVEPARVWPAACPRSGDGSSRACRPISPPRRFRRPSTVATGQPRWGGGTTPS